MIIDGHSHFGIDYYAGNIDIKKYLEYASKLGVDVALLMPPPSPAHYNNSKINKILKVIYKEDFIYVPNKNPFINMNYYYNDLIKKFQNETNIKLVFIPYVQPMLDEYELLKKLIIDFAPPFIKINGIQSGVIPDRIDSKFIKLIKEYDIPLIIHTQYQKEYNDPFIGNNIIKEINKPLNWALFLKDNHVKGILNHGCGLDDKTIDIVNNNDNIYVALGPDLAISCNNNRIKPVLDSDDKLDYLKRLKLLINYKKIIFDIDYNWNITDINCNINEVERIKTVFNDEESESILGNNILKLSKKLQRDINNK